MLIVFVVIAALVVGYIIYKALEASGSTPVTPPPPTPGPLPPDPVHLTLINQSRFVNATDMTDYLKAQQTQIDRDFQPSWGGKATIDVLPGGWPVYLLDVTDFPGALGYHDVDSTGTPYAKVFVATSENAGVAWESVASHEVLETLGDANANTSVVGPDGCNWYREVGDPCEDKSYSVNGVILSDFVLPSWFSADGKLPFDFLDILDAPFTITPGGYVAESCGTAQSLKEGNKKGVSVDRVYP